MLFLLSCCLRNRLCLFWHGFAPSVHRWAFTMPGELGTSQNETEKMPNHALQRQMTKADTSRQQWNGERRF